MLGRKEGTQSSVERRQNRSRQVRGAKTMNRASQQFAILTAATVALAILLQTSPAMAQSYNTGVADVSAANGNVVIVRGDSGTQVAAAVNAPVVAGDYLSTGPGATAEVQFDGVSMLRLAPDAQVRFVNLSPGSRETQLGAGTVDLAELQGTDGGAQIDTPSVTIRPNTTGDYRVSVLGNGQTAVTVRSGSAMVTSGAGSRTIAPGTTLVAYGPYSNPSISLQAAIGFDSFDQFNMSRDQSLASAYNANPYLSPQLAGSSNLANYGSWQDVPGYGWAWAPNNQNQNNFAPYQNGQWVWEPGYGYTWVDNAPYGYAVSHYGSWFNNANYGGWLWQPPAYQYQTSSNALGSAWLPAVVSFFLTGGSGFDLNSFGDNAEIGWIPLAPGQQYQPWYGPNYTYPATEVTSIPNVTNIYNYYPNARYYGGITTVPVSTWRSGRSHYTIVRPQQLTRIYVIRGAVPLVPTTANLHYTSARISRPVTISHAFTTARFAAKAPVAHVSFAQQQTRIKAIAAAKPKVVSLPEHRVTAHPVYHPAKHAEVHVVTMKPMTHEAAPAKHVAPAAAPEHESHPATAQKSPAHPQSAAKPVEHSKPAAKPVVHEAPAAKPVVHEAPAAKPVVHEAPAPKPVVHEAPAVKPPTAPAPQKKSVTHEALPAKAAPHAPPAKTETKATEEKPAARPTHHPS